MNSKLSPQDHPSHSINPSDRWTWHRRTLLALRDRLHRQAHSHLAELGGLNRDDPDFAARAREESDLDALVSEVNSEEGLLTEVQAALDRLDHGTYGTCEGTGDPISPERLRAIPWTRFCRAHAAARET
jgi:DnaK suppressor protein